MELRLLTSESELSVFLNRLTQARARHGSSFQENCQSRALNRRRLDSSRLYGLFRNDTAPAVEMIAGIALHDLRSFPQSCSEPDLSHLPPETVAECSDHWSLSNGAGMLVWAGLALPVRLMGIKAILAYLAAVDGICAHAGFYESMGFVTTGPVIPHPFVEDAQGRNVLVQPVLVQGEALETGMAAFSKACTEYSDDARVFHLKNFIKPMGRRTAGRLAAPNSPTLGSLAEVGTVESPAST
jgi:hypothetical protein